MVSVIPPFDGKIDRFLKCMIVLLHLFAILSGLLFGSGRAQGLGKNLLSQSFEAKVFCRHSFRSWHTKVLFDKHSRSFRALMTYKISKFTGFCHRAIWRKIDRLEFLNSALLLRLLCSCFFTLVLLLQFNSYTIQDWLCNNRI